MKLDPVTLSGVAVGKPVYALCTLNPKTRELKAQYYTLMIEGGPQPLWGVWTIHGTFKRFFIKKTAVEKIYHRLVWRRLSARLTLTSPIVDQTVAEEKTKLVNHYEALKAGRQGNVVPFEPSEGKDATATTG